MFWTPICECDIFRKAMAGRRFFGVSKKTLRGTRATPDLAKQERRAPRPAVQNVAETRPKIAPTRPADAARLAKATAGRDAAFSTCKIRRREAPSRRLIGHRRVAVFGVAQREGRTPPGEAARREAGVRRPRDHRPKTRPSTGKQPVAQRGSSNRPRPTTKRPPTADPRPQTRRPDPRPLTSTEDRTDRKIHRPIQSIIVISAILGDFALIDQRQMETCFRPRSAGVTYFAMQHLSVAFSTCQKARREALPRRSIWHCKIGERLAPRPKTWPKRRPKSHQADPRTPRDSRKQ